MIEKHNPANSACPLNSKGWAASIPPYCNCGHLDNSSIDGGGSHPTPTGLGEEMLPTNSQEVSSKLAAPQEEPWEKTRHEMIEECMYGNAIDFTIHADGSVEYPKSYQLYGKIHSLLHSQIQMILERVRKLRRSEENARGSGLDAERNETLDEVKKLLLDAIGE